MAVLLTSEQAAQAVTIVARHMQRHTHSDKRAHHRRIKWVSGKTATLRAVHKDLEACGIPHDFSEHGYSGSLSGYIAVNVPL